MQHTGTSPDNRRVRAHFHVSLPSFRSTWRRSTIHRLSGAEVKGTPSGPGGVPRCERLWAETNAAFFFFPTSVSSAVKAANLLVKASKSVCLLPGPRAKLQQSHARISPLGRGWCARAVRSANVD
eukprot:3749089-Pleurochrysis_carterae.AAC.1